MKANELMIGDFIRTIYTKKIIRVREIKQSCIYTNDNGYEYNEIEPIPITPDILLKNGWKRLTSPEGEDVFVLDLETITLWWFVKDKELVLIGGSHLKIEYVHQLQHALRMCNVSKEIKL